jgi:hypothetical protein
MSSLASTYRPRRVSKSRGAKASSLGDKQEHWVLISFKISFVQVE